MGATSGIGLEVALQLAEKGWQVAVAGRRRSLLESLAQRHGNIGPIAEIDITLPDAPTKLDALFEAMGEVDLYFHSSGIGFQNTNLDIERELSTVRTNADGFVQMVVTAFRHFANNPSRCGHIAAITSIARTKGLGAAPAYSATKRFQSHYLECLQQLATIQNFNIHLTDIRPGFVETALIEGQKYPLQLQPKAVAAKIVRAIERNKAVVTIDWRYRLLVAIWKCIPHWLWVRMKVK